MKVVLKASICEAIHARLIEAQRRNRKVDYILVTPEEYADLRREVNSPLGWGHAPTDSFRTIELKNPSPTREYPYVRFPIAGQYQGFDLFVVPSRFCE